MIEKAKNLCYKAYYGQLDKAGNSYYSYLLDITNRCTTEDEKVVALLHKTVENNIYSLETLAKLGVNRKNLLAIETLNKVNLTKGDYINTVKENKIARVVKIADIEYLLNLPRFKNLTLRDEKTYYKFENYLKILKNNN